MSPHLPPASLGLDVWARRRRGRHCLRAVAGACLAIGVSSMPAHAATSSSQGSTYASEPAPTAVSTARCHSGDRPEANTLVDGLQGQVPRRDRASGRAALGYSCNLRLIGQFASTAWATLDSFQNCAYYGDSSGVGGTMVLDVTNPTAPQLTARLTSPAMVAPWESLRVNARRGLLVADHDQSPWLDVYDISRDCRKPSLLSSTEMPTGRGHEGWFSPDGMTYYMTGPVAGAFSEYRLTAVDLSNPRRPREIGTYAFPGGVHGGSSSSDGRRAYVCNSFAIPNTVAIVDTSSIQRRDRDARAPIIGTIALPDVGNCQSNYEVFYGSRRHLIQYGESRTNGALGASPSVLSSTVSNSSNPAVTTAASLTCDGVNPSFSVPHIIDLTDEKHPRLASALVRQVDEPRNCLPVSADKEPSTNPQLVAINNIFNYDVHHCSPDRLVQPTILACGQFNSGLRVYDIRNPQRPRELAYYNPGMLYRDLDSAVSRPVIRPDRREIWFTTALRGFQVLKFAPGVWPFRESLKSCSRYDAYRAQYDRGYASRCLQAGAGAAVNDGTTLAVKAGRNRSLPASGLQTSLTIVGAGLSLAAAAGARLLRRRPLGAATHVAS